MRRFGLLFLVLALGAGAALTTAAVSSGAPAKRTICHRAASAKTPYSKVTVSASQLRAHLRHAADIYPVPAGGCPKTVLTANGGGTAFAVAMTGEVETPAGDPVATGTATLRLRAGQGQLCYKVAAANLPVASAMHIHRGGAGVAGAVVVPLKTPNASGAATGCATVARTLVAAILGSPAGYYLNIHTTEFPAGAIRGQLSGTSTASFGWVATLALQGTSEPNAKGSAALRIRKDDALVCYRLHVENVTLTTVAAHIHRGAAGVNGPVVVPFTAPAANALSSGCQSATAALIDEILGNPVGFYVNVHTTEHPAGAIRAQLG
jgi:CHRD domain